MAESLRLVIPGSLEAIATLRNAGYTVTVATNQSGIARGHFDEQMFDTIHDKMLVLAGNGEKTAKAVPEAFAATPICADLATAADVLAGAGA